MVFLGVSTRLLMSSYTLKGARNPILCFLNSWLLLRYDVDLDSTHNVLLKLIFHIAINLGLGIWARVKQ